MGTTLPAKAMAVANSDVNVYTCPTTGVSFVAVNILLTNQDTVNAAHAKIWIGPGPTPAPDDYVDFNIPVNAAPGSYERVKMLVYPGESVFVNCDNANVSIRVYGIPQA